MEPIELNSAEGSQLLNHSEAPVLPFPSSASPPTSLEKNNQNLHPKNKNKMNNNTNNGFGLPPSSSTPSTIVTHITAAALEQLGRCSSNLNTTKTTPATTTTATRKTTSTKTKHTSGSNTISTVTAKNEKAQMKDDSTTGGQVNLSEHSYSTHNNHSNNNNNNNVHDDEEEELERMSSASTNSSISSSSSSSLDAADMVRENPMNMRITNYREDDAVVNDFGFSTTKRVSFANAVVLAEEKKVRKQARKVQKQEAKQEAALQRQLQKKRGILRNAGSSMPSASTPRGSTSSDPGAPPPAAGSSGLPSSSSRGGLDQSLDKMDDDAMSSASRPSHPRQKLIFSVMPEPSPHAGALEREKELIAAGLRFRDLLLSHGNDNDEDHDDEEEEEGGEDGVSSRCRSDQEEEEDEGEEEEEHPPHKPHSLPASVHTSPTSPSGPHIHEPEKQEEGEQTKGTPPPNRKKGMNKKDDAFATPPHPPTPPQLSSSHRGSPPRVPSESGRSHRSNRSRATTATSNGGGSVLPLTSQAVRFLSQISELCTQQIAASQRGSSVGQARGTSLLSEEWEGEERTPEPRGPSSLPPSVLLYEETKATGSGSGKSRRTTTTTSSDLPSLDIESSIASAEEPTSIDVKLLFNSWKAIMKKDIKRFARDVAREFFSERPDFMQLFEDKKGDKAVADKEKKDLDSDDSNDTHHSNGEETTPQMEISTKHLRAMVSLFGMAKQALIITAQPLTAYDQLRAIGARHRFYGVRFEHFQEFQRSFMEVLPVYVARMKDTSERRKVRILSAWKNFWVIVVQLLTAGGESTEGRLAGIERDKDQLQWCKKLFHTFYTCPQSCLIRRTLMAEVYQRAVETNPDMKKYSLLQEPRVSMRLVDGFENLIELLIEGRVDDPYFDLLAVKHMTFGLTVQSMRDFRDSFIQSCLHFFHLVHEEEHGVQEYKKEEEGMKTELDIPYAHEALGRLWDQIMIAWSPRLQVAQKTILDAQSMHAPDGSQPFCLLFTDIEASTRLWEMNGDAMARAVQAHHRMIRSLITECGAYEVKTVGDSFVIAAKDPLIALEIAVGIQLELMRCRIALDFTMVENTQGSGDADCWRADSLRVRVGVHYCGDVKAVYDSVQRRYDYYGPGINIASRTESQARGGQILITEPTYEALLAMPDYTTKVLPLLRYDARVDGEGVRRTAAGSVMPAKPLQELIEILDWGYHKVRGIQKNLHLYCVQLNALAGRVFTNQGEEK